MTRKASRADLAFIASLHRTATRKEHGLFLAEGEKAMQELLASHIQIKTIACTTDYWEAHIAALQTFEVVTVSDAELQRISTLTNPNQVLAVCHIPNFDALRFIPQETTYLMLDHINDPGNMGTMIRTAEWFGVQAIITSPNSVDVWNPKVVQASMGSLFRLAIYQNSLTDAIHDAQKSGVPWIVGGVLGGQPLHQLNRMQESMVLVIGSESHGISNVVLPLLTHRIAIARHVDAPTESLNASVAAGILLHHFCKQ